MAETLCPTLSSDPAITFTSGAYDTFMNLAPRTFDAAIEQAGRLTSFTINPISFNADFSFNDQLSPFTRPPRPVINAERFIFQPPEDVPAPPTFTAGQVNLEDAPDYNIADPIVSYGPRPDTPVVAVPVAPPRADPVIVPDVPQYTLPPVPTLIDLNLPKVPDIVIPGFDAVRPNFDVPTISENWSWEPGKYTSALMDKVKAKVSGMMDGSTGLEPIEAALFGRGRDRIEIETRRDIDTRVSEFATRGFFEPSGVLAQSIDEIIQNGANRKADLSREVMIQSYQESLVNLRFSVQQGIACEQVAVNLFLEEQRMSLQAAQFMRETSLALLNAKISVFQMQLAAFQADAQVYETRIRAALAQVELYRAQIEGQRVLGEINDQKVRVYQAMMQSLGVMADFYRAQVAGVQAKADVQRSVIESYKAEVDAYSARWRAYSDEFSAYRAQIEAENSKVTVHRNLVDAFATRVQATNNTNRGRIDAEQLRIQQFGQDLQTWQGLLSRLDSRIRGESARVTAEGQRAGALATIYSSDAAVESAASAANDRQFTAGLERARAQTETNLEAARIAIQQNISLTQTRLEAVRTQSQVLAQLAASALSAMNFSASVSSSRSESKGCSTNFSWSGEIADYD